jgi:cyclopropane fatty-acyl-phospholipid synthase-like methyltransferase
MNLKDQMENIYQNTDPDKIPWNTVNPPELLLDFLNNNINKADTILELGCGAGNYVMYLSGKGYKTTGVDFSETAINMARNSSEEKKLDCKFIVADVTKDLSELNTSFDFVYDWELLHHILPEQRSRYVNNVYKLVKPRGYYFSVCFSEKSDQFGGEGKYRKTPLNTELYFSSEEEMFTLFDPFFEIVKLSTVEIEGKYAPHKAIYAVLKKR